MHTLPKLSYSYDALEPYIDSQTMEIHHTKHHQAYVDNLNKALQDYPELGKLALNDLLAGNTQVPENSRQSVINSAGGHANHSFFWQVIGPSQAKVQPAGKLLEAINSTFGDFEKFSQLFTDKAMGVFGSGWAFLIMTPDHKLQLKRHSFQNSPLLHSNVPILCIDVWEHAYYLKYQNRRAEYVQAFWHIVNWDAVEAIYTSAQTNR